MISDRTKAARELLALLRIKARHPKRRVRGCKYLALSHEWAAMADNVPLAGVSHFFLQAAEACGITGGNWLLVILGLGNGTGFGLQRLGYIGC
jgi:hypothetical protein